MASLIFIILLSLLMLLFILSQKHRKTKNSKLPPGPQGLPLIGNLFQFDLSNPQVTFWELSKKYGPIMLLRLGFRPTLVVSSAKMAQEILKTHDLQFCSRPALIGPHKLAYDGLDLVFSPYGDYWREIRKICVVHLFNTNRVQNFRPIREYEVRRLIEKVSKSADASKPINLSDMMLFLTITLMCRIGFGKRYEDESSERSKFQSLLFEADVMFVSFFYADYFPFMRWVDKLTGLIRRLETSFQECDTFYQEIINQHLDPKRKVTAEQEDLIDVLLQLRKDRGFKFDLTLDHIKAILMNVFVAGTETSAATVVWAMTYLMKNPKTMEKVQEEIRRSIGQKEFIDEEDVQKMPYLKAVVKETMRLQPTVPLLVPRESIEKCTIDGYEIPAKALVYVNAWAIGRDPEVWENPEEFYPERFMDSSVDYKGQHFELIPFGAGRRMCPGLPLGMATVYLSLANLLCKFDLEMPTGMKREDLDLEPLPGITMHKKNSLSLMAKHHV